MYAPELPAFLAFADLSIHIVPLSLFVSLPIAMRALSTFPAGVTCAYTIDIYDGYIRRPPRPVTPG